jgi:hypothetical protein
MRWEVAFGHDSHPRHHQENNGTIEVEERRRSRGCILNFLHHHMRNAFGLGTVAAAVVALGLGMATPSFFQTPAQPMVRPAYTAVVRLGSTGGRLSVADLNQIAQAARGSIGDSWVVVGQSPGMMPPPRWFVTVFGLPNHHTALVRRGPTITVVAALTTPTSYEDQKTWGITGSVREYAQVPVPGSDPHIVRDGRDLNRPFRVVGELTDETLAAVVALVRTSPTIPPPLSAKGQPVASISPQSEAVGQSRPSSLVDLR